VLGSTIKHWIFASLDRLPRLLKPKSRQHQPPITARIGLLLPGAHNLSLRIPPWLREIPNRQRWNNDRRAKAYAAELEDG